MGVHWEHGSLCAKTLHDALHSVGLDPLRQSYINAFVDGDLLIVDEAALARIRGLADGGAELVALGQAAYRALSRANLPHLHLTHPAARGAIRARAAYRTHPGRVLGLAARRTEGR